MLRSHHGRMPKDVGEAGHGVLLLRSHNLTLMLNAKWEWRYVVVDPSKAGVLLCRSEGDYRRGLIGRVLHFQSIESVDRVIDVPELRRKSISQHVPLRFRILATNTVRRASNWIFEAGSAEDAKAWVTCIREASTLVVHVYRNLHYTNVGTEDSSSVSFPEEWMYQSAIESHTQGNNSNDDNVPQPVAGRYAKCAICLSGGGMRSLVSCVGQLRALKKLGVLNSDNIGYISSVSGGAWASSVYTYFQDGIGARDDDDLLGLPVEDISTLTLAHLAEPPPALARVAMSKFSPLARKFLLRTRPSHLYERIVGEVILSPFGLDDGVPFVTNEMEQVLRDSNPVLARMKMHVPTNSKRPFWIANGVVMVPRRKHEPHHFHSIVRSISTSFGPSEEVGHAVGESEPNVRPSAPKDLIPIQFTSMYSGNPVLYEINPECQMEDCPEGTMIRVGGSMIDTFGFGTREPAMGNATALNRELSPQNRKQVLNKVFGSVAANVRELLNWKEEVTPQEVDEDEHIARLGKNEVSRSSHSGSLSDDQEHLSDNLIESTGNSSFRKSRMNFKSFTERLSLRKGEKLGKSAPAVADTLTTPGTHATKLVDVQASDTPEDSSAISQQPYKAEAGPHSPTASGDYHAIEESAFQNEERDHASGVGGSEIVEIKKNGFEVSKVRVPFPNNFFSLKRAIGISSHVMALSLHNSRLGKAFIPKASLWSPQLELRDALQDPREDQESLSSTTSLKGRESLSTVNRTPSLMRSQTQAFSEAVNVDVADGGFVDIFGIFPVLQRKITKCIVFLNTAHPLPADPEVDLKRWGIAELTSLFGFLGQEKVTAERKHYLRNNQVFEEKELRPLLQGLQKAKAEGKPVIMRQHLKVLSNPRVGCEGGWELDIIWFYLSRSEKFVDLLPEETQFELNKPTVGQGGVDSSHGGDMPEFYENGEPVGKFNLFPQYKTTNQNKDSDASYTAEQINLLSRFTEWTVLESALDVKNLLLVQY